MSNLRVVVIGAGVAGLAAGCYATAQGFECLVVERHEVAGGVAATWRRGDYVIDGGIHFLFGHNPGLSTYELYRDLGILPGLPVSETPVLCRFLDERTDRAIEISRNLDRLALELRQLSPDDSEHIDDLIGGAKSMGLLEWGLTDKPEEIMSFRDKLRQTWRLRHGLRYFGGAYVRPVSEVAGKIEHPLVRSLVMSLVVPEAPLWLVMMFLSAFSRGQMALLPQGSVSLVGRLVERFEAGGGVLRTGCGAAEVVTTRQGSADRAVGIVLEDGERVEADYVITAADGYSTVYELLGGRYLDEATAARYREWSLVRPLVMVSLGVARRFTGEPPLNTIMLRRPFFVGDTTVDTLSLRIFNYAPGFAPAGKTVIQASFETSWNHWSSLLERDRSAYDAEKERMAREVIRRLELHYPGIMRQVELVDVATPHTTWRYTHNLRGAYEGWLPTPEVIVSAIPRSLPGLSHLFMAGQWVVPGGGIPTCLLSGRHAVQLICNNEGLPFRLRRP